MLKYKLVKFVEVENWDALVTEVYDRPYKFQQQDGCKERQVIDFTVPAYSEDYDDSEEGVSFKTWFTR